MLDHDACYRAVASRDARFDGQFVTAVRTTGIYCRPSCPVPPPLPQNVEFLPTAAAAQAGGYRACRRCVPDAAPGSAAWNVRADVATRAMHLIADGVVEHGGVRALAGRLGWSPRHLGRILRAELGAGPLALARAHRAHTARMLIQTTALPMADVAFASGFRSVRQFNETMRAAYGTAPGALRRAAPGRRADGSGAVTLRLAYRAPFDPHGLLEFLRARAIDGVELVRGSEYHRTLRLPRGPGSVAVDLAAGGGAVRATLRPADPRDIAPAVARLRRLLDLDADPQAVDAVLGADPALAGPVAKTPGVRVAGSVDGPETAVRTVLGQQVSVAAARTAASRLAAALGEPLPAGLRSADDAPHLLFPDAATIAARGGEVLTGPARRVATVIGLCERLAAGDIVLDAGQDPRALRDALCALPGLGPWSAGYIAMRVLGDPDELLASDLAVRRGAEALGLPGDAAGLAARAARWAPWRSYAATHLWRAAASGPTLTRRRTA